MSAVKVFDTREDAEREIAGLLPDWPAARLWNLIGEEKWNIVCDYAGTKFLHDDGHIY